MTRNIIGIAIVALVVGFAVTAVQAGTISNVRFTDDESSDIKPTKTYTHLFDGGKKDSVPAKVNGVQFNLLTNGDTGVHPRIITGTNIVLQIFPDEGLGFNNYPGFNGSGIPDTEKVFDLLDDILYDCDGSSHTHWTMTLSGLVPDTKYDMRLYYKKWGTQATRMVTVAYDEDGDGIFNASNDSIYFNADAADGGHYLSYKYTASALGKVVVKFTADDLRNSWHWCGVSNEVVPEPSTLALLAAGLVGLLAYAWRRRR